MLISIHDHTLKRVGFLSNDDSETPDFKDDNFHRYLAQGTSTFDFTVNKIKNGVVQDYVQLLNERAYFSFQYEGEDFLFDSVIVEEDDDKITFNCLTLNLEMRNEEVKALTNTASHNIQWYFDQLGLINFAKISLGINQVENDTRTINYDSEDTKLARLISVIQNFDAEFEFVTKLKRDGTLDNITLNIYKKNDGGDVQGVGQNRNDVLLSFGENVTGVNRKVEKSQIFNSLYVTGKDGLNWKTSAWSVTNSEGQEEFYKRAGESYAKAPLSAQMFPSQLQSSSGDIFTNKNESTEYTTVNAMWGYALSQLKQYAYPLITYEVTATSNLTVSSTGDGMPLHIGDTVRIQDKNFIDSDGNVGLFLSARVSELEISFTNPTSNKITFSNYIKLKSEVSDDLTARMQEIINANTPYRPDITSTNGLQFKNGTGTTTLGAHIYFGSDDKETIADSYEWSKDGTVVANAQTITVDASGVVDKAVYSFKATVTGKVVASQSVTITNVNDGAKGAQGPQGPQGLKGDPGATGIPGQVGADGKTSYLHIAYATNSTGTAGFDVSNATGKTYIGQYTDFTSDDSTDPSKYTWSLIKGDKGDKGDQGDQGIQGLQGPTGTQGVAGPKGADGKTQYTHIAYANSADGVTDFSTSDSNRTYIGIYVDFNISDSTTPSDYSWTLVKGADGTQGTPGKPGADGKTPYFHTAWSYSADGTNGFTTVYPNLNLWRNTKSQSYTSTGTSQNLSANLYSLDAIASDLIGKNVVITYDYVITNSTGTWSGFIRPTAGFGGTNYPVSNTNLKGSVKQLIKNVAAVNQSNYPILTLGLPAGTKVTINNLKVEIGSIDTPYMPSASEATTADWPSYIGQYTDFTQADSTNPSDYTWSLIRGNDGAAGPQGPQGPTGPAGSNGTPGTNAINIDLSNKSYNFLANLEVSDSGSVMQAVAGSTTTTFTALQGTAAINITALTCTTTLPTGMTVSIGTLNALSVVVTISVDNTMITPNGVLNFSITAGGVTTTKSFSYSLAINDLTVINLAAINSNLGNVKNIYSHYNGSDGGTYSGTIEINDENIKITATNDNDSNEVSKTQMNGENGIWHSTKLQKTNSPGVYVLSNWSLTGATLSFESQQSDLTYPNGYSYASYGIDVHARNIVGDNISQTMMLELGRLLRLIMLQVLF